MNVDDDPRFGRFGLRTDCPRCGAHLPVNGPAPTVDCADCGHTVGVPAPMIADLFRDFEKEWPDSQGSGTIVRGDITWRWTAAPVEAPACPSCGEALPDAPEAGEVACGACQTAVPVFQVPRDCRAGVKTAALVIGGSDDLSRPAEPPKPVVLQCPQCGAGLSIGHERSRITPCEYCNSQVHLPDAVWRALHPPREVREWFVRFDGEGPAAAKARSLRDKEEKRRQAAENKQKKQAKKQAIQAEHRKKLDAERHEREETAARQKRFRNLTGLVGVLFAAVLALAACAVMGASIVAYGAPWMFEAAGIGHALLLTQSLIVAGVVSALVAWFVGVVAAAWRGNVPLLGSLGMGSFHLLASVAPFVGVVFALVFAFGYTRGRFPAPPGPKWQAHRNPLGSGWPVALLLPVTSVFCTVALAMTLDLTLWELFVQMGED
ncbi:MAG: MFS transporter [Alphaproteobacteria bacterium]|nr:MFS transporter [Alphaproteobacteria bacterium]